MIEGLPSFKAIRSDDQERSQLQHELPKPIAPIQHAESEQDGLDNQMNKEPVSSVDALPSLSNDISDVLEPELSETATEGRFEQLPNIGRSDSTKPSDPIDQPVIKLWLLNRYLNSPVLLLSPIQCVQ